MVNVPKQNGSCIIPILGKRKPLDPFGRTVIHKTAQEGLHELVHMLSLPIGLRVIHCTHSQLDTSQCKQFLLKMGSEYGIAIRNDGHSETM